MKKSIVLAIVGLAAGMATSSYGQGVILLDNYNTYGPYVTYGAGSDGTVGTGVNASYTMGLYYFNALGDNTGVVNFDPTGIALPNNLGNLLLGSGAGSTAAFGFGDTPGGALSGSAWVVPIVPGPTGATVTLMVVAYNGASYALATDRGHSAAFTIATSDSSSPTPVRIGTVMPAFSVAAVPEPTTMALAGLGGLSLLLFRRKQS